MNIDLTIGGFTIRIGEPNGYPQLAWPLRPFETFLSDKNLLVDLDVEVNIVPHLPELETGELRFDSGRGLWRLFDSDEGYVLESLHTLTLQPRVRAHVSYDYRTVRAWILPELMGGQVGWCPMYLFNPIVEVCFLSLLANAGGLLLHASGLSHHGQAFVFTGPSGAGKSTIAQFFADRGAVVLSDERILLRPQDSTMFLHGTPWVGSGEYAANGKAPLTALYAIQHGTDRHTIAPMAQSQAMSMLMQQAFLPHWDRDGMERTLDTLMRLTTTIPAVRLSALKQPDVVEAVQGHTSSLATTVA